MVYDSTSLHTELTASGLKIKGCSSNGSIDWDKTPSSEEQAVAFSVLSLHNPKDREKKEEAEKKEIREPLLEILAATQNTETWANLTAAQRWDLVRRALYVLALYLKKVV